MPDEPSYYTPERVDRILRNWPRYLSAAEGCRSALPNALRPARGRPRDPLAAADIVADIERAMRMLTRWPLPWTLVSYRRQGRTFSQIAEALHLSKTTVHQGYQDTVKVMVAYLDPSSPAPEELL